LKAKIKRMKTSTKMSREERRAAIVQAVRAVFAEKGSHGSTTRELAQAAGVSEALLFKHFPNKDALYAAMIQSCIQDKDHETIARLLALEPCTSTLVLHVHLMVSHFVGGPRPGEGHEAVLVRLLQRSMMEDGDYARLLHRRLGLPMIQKLERCIEAAIAAGDAVAGPSQAVLTAWFAQHLAMTVMFHLLPTTPIIDYGLSRAALIEQVVWFSLRGMGVKDEAIKRYYHPEAVAQFVNGSATEDFPGPKNDAAHSARRAGSRSNGSRANGSQSNGAQSNGARTIGSKPE
jgi:AcrR family transcriptional regulator